MRRWNLSGSERIEEEYKKLDDRWMRSHYQAMLFATALAALAEVGMYGILRDVGPSFGGAWDYWTRFVAIPIGGNLQLDLAGLACLRSRRLNRQKKQWALSLLTSLMVLWIYTMHMFYAAMSLIFAVPVLLVMAYGSRHMVRIVALLSFAEKIFADFFLNGWSGRASPVEDSAVLIDFIMSMVLLVFFFGLAWFITGIEAAKNTAGIVLERERHLYKMRSITDPMTRLGNRLALEEALQSLDRRDMLSRCHAAVLDLDEFKRLNDTLGHSQGDQCLRDLGDAIRAIGSEEMEGYRMGGDEFCLLFLDRTTEQVLDSCRALQEAFRAASSNTDYAFVHVSIGVARALPGEGAGDLLDHADRALYRAKGNKGSICLDVSEGVAV